MIKFFRKLRWSTLSRKRFPKYFLYAMGEIILVVIGILIALGINNWNQKRISKDSLINYYERIHDELSYINPGLIYFSGDLDTLITANKRSLHILNLKNRDSLEQLKYTIGALGTSYVTDASFPITEEFLNQGNLARIQNKEIKVQFQRFGEWMIRLNSFDGYIKSQYATSIEPFFYDKVNYAQTVFSNYNQDGLVVGGPETDYGQFYNDMELWNLLTFKLESLNGHSRDLKSFTAYIKTLDSLIVKEIKATSK